MKSKLIKILSVTLALVLVCAGTFMVFAQQGDTDKDSNSSTNNNKKTGINDFLSNDLIDNSDVDKEETVYVIAGNDGTAKKVIVSDWLKNSDKSNEIKDSSYINNIVNVNGEEQFTTGDNNSIVWNAEGKDIYYQGTSETELPVTVNVTYLLDGKEISASELAGKSGNVTMKFDFTNNQKQTVMINGKQEEMYVPFVMLGGAILDNDQFSNVKVSNGKIINDGERTIVIGFGMPGMQESLSIDKDKLDIPENIEITAEVNDFSLDTVVLLATNEMFNGLNLDNMKSVDGLQDSLKQLNDSVVKLSDGSSALYDGLTELLNKSNELVGGIKKLADGSQKLADGSNKMNSGSSQLQQGVSELSKGLEQLSSNSAKINGGANQLFEKLLSTAQAQLKAASIDVPQLTIENYKAVLTNVINSLGGDNAYDMVYAGALEKVTAAVKSNEATIVEKVTEGVKAQVMTEVLKQMNMTLEQYQKALAAGKISKEIEAKVNAAVENQMSSEKIKATITTVVNQKEDELIKEKMESDEVKAQIKETVAKAQSGGSSINELVAQLDSYKQFYDGVTAYTAGVDKAYLGSKAIDKGALDLSQACNQLYAGAKTLNDGMQTVNNNTGALIEGIAKLQNGSMQISDGMKKFKKEGIDKIMSLVNDDDLNILDRIKSLVEISKDYQSFGGKSDDMTGRVKFVYRTEAIEKEN